jgi:hypothetical protein
MQILVSNPEFMPTKINPDTERGRRSMKKYGMALGGIFAASVGVVIGYRLSGEAMAVVVGIVCGILATVPMVVVLVWTLRVREKQVEAQLRGLGGGFGAGQYPPIVVVNGQGTTGNGPPVPMLNGGGSRQFKVIGQEQTETGSDRLSPIWDDL